MASELPGHMEVGSSLIALAVEAALERDDEKLNMIDVIIESLVTLNPKEAVKVFRAVIGIAAIYNLEEMNNGDDD